MVPAQLAAYASVMYFQQFRQCIEEELLDRFMAHEKSRLEDERTALRQVNTSFFLKTHYYLLSIEIDKRLPAPKSNILN